MSSLKIREKEIELDDGRMYPFDALLIATGAQPVRLNIPGTPAIPIHYLRTFGDSQAIIDALSSVKRAVVVGASFYRSRGGRIAARARSGRGCRGTRPRAARACDGSGRRPLRKEGSRGERRGFTSAPRWAASRDAR